jgi:nucleotide-binding universal stress UspA family protein
VVVHAHDVDTTLRPDLAGLPSELDGAMTRSARGFLDHLLTSVAVLGGRPRSVAWRVVAGDPKRALVDAAVGASMLVLGSPHPHGVVEHVVGSTARHCVREANCPVVIVPAAGPEALECAS